MRIHTPRPRDLDQAPEQELDDLDFEALAEEADDGLVAPMIADDPEHDRLIDPED